MKMTIFDPIKLIIQIVLIIIRGWRKTVAAWQGTKVGGFITERYNRFSGWLNTKIFSGLEKLITWEGSSFPESLTYKYYRLHGQKHVVSLSRLWKKIVETWTGSSIGGFITRKYNLISGWLGYKVFRFFEKLIRWEGSSFSESLTYKYYRLHGQKHVVSLSSRWKKIAEAWANSSIGGFIARKYNRITRKLGTKVFQFLEKMIRWEAKPVEDTLMYGYYERYGKKVKKSASRIWAKVLATQSGSVSASHAHRSYKLYHWMLGSIWDKYQFAILTVVFAIIAGAIIVVSFNTFKIDRSSSHGNSLASEEYYEVIMPPSETADKPDSPSLNK